MKKRIILILLLTSTTTFSQLKITGYFDAKIGLNYAFTDNFQVELSANDNLNSEFGVNLSILYKIINKEDYNLNFGAGITTFPFHSKFLPFYESAFLPLQIEITPFKELRNFGLVVETAYHFSELNGKSGIRNSVGIRYIFD
ncbi:hypothetical protein OD91_1055 [Lutibacter sp. Hel_I_33_5]|uniref:hypothetical protein n=1 Tax=Lutibacter sp. Hel_I_33_5 TaxID=1566289 RepID=UPI0011A9B6E3|nr:hypothetical protein [Lutibacter sp. Hel_I_33_5]TVZ55788.1 hypothetical protein OD91_1055 [Lutibacter sp. Hel_I_33_5]